MRATSSTPAVCCAADELPDRRGGPSSARAVRCSIRLATTRPAPSGGCCKTERSEHVVCGGDLFARNQFIAERTRLGLVRPNLRVWFPQDAERARARRGGVDVHQPARRGDRAPRPARPAADDRNRALVQRARLPGARASDRVLVHAGLVVLILSAAEAFGAEAAFAGLAVSLNGEGDDEQVPGAVEARAEPGVV